MASLLREGGAENLQCWLSGLRWALSSGASPGRDSDPPTFSVTACPDPDPFDWRDEPGPRVGVVLYRAHRQSADVHWCTVLLATLRSCGLVPRALWVSGLRDPAVQEAVQRLYRQQQVELVITSTSFASVQMADAGLGAPLWDRLGCPVLQMLSSGRSRDQWIKSFLIINTSSLLF